MKKMITVAALVGVTWGLSACGSTAPAAKPVSKPAVVAPVMDDTYCTVFLPAAASKLQELNDAQTDIFSQAGTMLGGTKEMGAQAANFEVSTKVLRAAKKLQRDAQAGLDAASDGSLSGVNASVAKIAPDLTALKDACGI